jgi:hypothetical protein
VLTPASEGSYNMLSIFARGRIAWILSMILGTILVIVGSILSPTNFFVIVAGAAFFLFGLVFLILSFVTHGQTD